MFKITRAYINAIKEGKYSKKIKLYDKTENGSVELDSSNSEVQKLQKLVEDDRDGNVAEYLWNTIALRIKKAITIAPLILGGLTIGSFLNIKDIKPINVDKVYEEKNIEFDEDSVLSKEDNIYAVTSLNKNYVDENINSTNYFVFDPSSYATIYYGEGNDALQAKFSINEDNTWEYSDYTNNLYRNNADYVTEPIGEIDIEYKELIEEATENFIKQAELSEEEISYVRELVSNNENDIIVKIKEYVNIGSATFDVHYLHWLRSLLALITEIVLVAFIIKNKEEILLVDDVKVNGSTFGTINCYDDIFILGAALTYEKAFLEAEENRISEIIEILKSYNGDEKIIAKYEKRLELNKNKKNRIITINQ